MIKYHYDDSVSYKELFERREVIRSEQGIKMYTVGMVGNQASIFDKNKKYVGEVVRKSNDLIIFHVDNFGSGKLVRNGNADGDNCFSLIYNDWNVEFCDNRYVVTCNGHNLSCHYIHGQKCFEIFDEGYVNFLAMLDVALRVIWDEILHCGN